MRQDISKLVEVDFLWDADWHMAPWSLTGSNTFRPVRGMGNPYINHSFHFLKRRVAGNTEGYSDSAKGEIRNDNHCDNLALYILQHSPLPVLLGMTMATASSHEIPIQELPLESPLRPV